MTEYPLQEVLEIKQRRVDKAQRELQSAREALKEEEEKLKRCEEARNKVLDHKIDKLRQLRDEIDHETTTGKVQQMKVYLKVVDAKLAEEEKKVEEQKEQVKAAEDVVEAAKEELRLKQLEVDKLETHKEEWTKAMKMEERRELEHEMDEIGSIIHQTKNKSRRGR